MKFVKKYCLCGGLIVKVTIYVPIAIVCLVLGVIQKPVFLKQEKVFFLW